MKRSYRSVRLVKSTVFIAYSRKRHFSLACFDRCMLSFVTKCNPKFCRLFHHSGIRCMHKSRVREKREYLQITAGKSRIIVIYCVIFSAEPDLFLFLYLKRAHLKKPWNLVIQTKRENGEAHSIIFINVHLYPRNG